MNSLQLISGYARQAVAAITLVSLLSFGIAAQNIDPQQQGKRYGDAGFVGESINLNVVNADIRDILNYITEQYGINFVIDRSVTAVPVTINVSDVPWNLALDSVLRSQNLGVQVNGPILRIADSKVLAAEGEIIRQQMDNRLDGAPLVTEFIRLNYARAKDGLARGTSSSGRTTTTDVSFDGSPSRPAGLPNLEATSGTGEGLLPIIQRRLSRRGSIEVDGRSNSLIITDVRENIEAVKQLVAILDQPEPQVEIEARIVVATRSFSRDIGVQLSGMVFGPRGSGAQGGTLDGAVSGNPFPATLPTQGPDGSLLSRIPNTVIGLTTGVFGTAQISALISAGEQKGQAKIIATPRVTTLNNRKAKIESKTQIPIQTIQPSAGGG
ncbi:MAG: hypothetical protein H0V76_09600, partial [Blastocatellia bacterium]|nr:hypothetical protein [Blastocatellia bacterium]